MGCKLSPNRIPVTRRNPQRERRPKKIAALDTETEGLNGKILMAQLYHEDWQGVARIYKGVDPARQLIDAIFSLGEKLLRETIFYAHNSQYDWRYLLECFIAYMPDYEFRPCERSAGCFYEIQVYSRTLETPAGRPLLITVFRDSYAVYNQTQSEFTKNFAPRYVKQDIGLGSGVIFDPENKVHEDYAANDVLGLVEAVINFDSEVYRHFHIHLKGTFSGTAYQGWLRFAPEDVYHDRLPAVVDEFVRLGYYGGNVSANAPLNVPMIGAHAYDRNSSYPASMRELGVPTGKPIATRSYKTGDIGWYRVTVEIPDDAILPIIPHRDAKGRLSWPTGLFDTVICNLEIERGRALGYRIDVHSGYRFPRVIFPFTEFVDTCEMLRTQYKGTPTEIVVKFMQNSVYGRFGMKTHGRTCALAAECPEGMVAMIDEETGRIIPYAFFKEEARDTEYMIPSYSAYITAGARMALDEFTDLVGRDNVRYRDTDSVTAVGALPAPAKAKLSKAYGDWKDEGEKRDFMVHAPKCCSWRALQKDGSWKWKFVYKGIPAKLMDDATLMQIRAGEKVVVTYNSTTGFGTYIKTGQKSIKRTRSSTDPESIYGHVVENGWFRPRRASGA